MSDPQIPRGVRSTPADRLTRPGPDRLGSAVDRLMTAHHALRQRSLASDAEADRWRSVSGAFVRLIDETERLHVDDAERLFGPELDLLPDGGPLPVMLDVAAYVLRRLALVRSTCDGAQLIEAYLEGVRMELWDSKGDVLPACETVPDRA